MEILDKHVALRRSMHDFYVDYFKDIDGVSVFEEPIGLLFESLAFCYFGGSVKDKKI